MNITLAQLACRVGDIKGNCAKIVEQACRCGEGILLTPELSICGYPPEDLLAYDEFISACEQGAASVAMQLATKLSPKTYVTIGLPARYDGKLYNVLRVLNQGEIVAEHRKAHLPNYGVFDELRYFAPGQGPTEWQLDGKRILLGICQDIWTDEFQLKVREAKPDVLLVANASPFYLGVQADRESHTMALSTAGMQVVYVNMVGGQDEHVFDGGSHVAVGGRITQSLSRFRPEASPIGSTSINAVLDEDEQIEAALSIGVHDYVAAAGGGPVFVGVSGGIDSAVVLCVAVQALGAENVIAVLMPSRYTQDISIEDGKQLAENLKVNCHCIDIEPVVTSMRASLRETLGEQPGAVTLENLQSRVRGNMLMTLANNSNGLVLTTGNKCEMATGYATLYGDMAGAYDVLKDMTKQRVYSLARHINRSVELIPGRIITRAPTAELREGQLDSDSLPDYDVLDAILVAMVEQLQDTDTVSRSNGVEATKQFARLLVRSEFKRRQAPIGPTMTKRAFGKDWRMPVANAYVLGGDGDS